MQSKTVQEVITYTCNNCGKEYNSSNICVEEINELGLLVIEKFRDGKGNHLAKHLQGRRVLDFCCKECLIAYGYKAIDMLAREVALPKSRSL